MDLKQRSSIGLPAGLQKSRKIIRAEQEKEAIFHSICKQIKIQDFKQTRSDIQKQGRITKRK